jgi:hypothetical protein
MLTVYSFKEEVSRKIGIRWEFMHIFVIIKSMKKGHSGGRVP